MIVLSLTMSNHIAPVRPKDSACSGTEVIGRGPLRDSWSPGICVISLTTTSAATHKRVQIIAALVMTVPLERSVNRDAVAPNGYHLAPATQGDFNICPCYPITAMTATRNSV
jgi:hypothetical protein